jgi:4-hydroxy-3-methylbut-2-en-1-yl diphosphate reductase
LTSIDPAKRRHGSSPGRRHAGLRRARRASISTDRLGDASARERLARTGVLIADRESAWLLTGRRDRPAACVRVVAGGTGLLDLGRALRTLPRVADWAATTAG